MQPGTTNNEAELKCVRNGCKKKYIESENNEKACHHHPGKPIFHDLKKGWTCCNQIVYDWDEFQNLRPCAVDRHTNIENKQENQSEFFKSNTVSNAQKALDKEKIVVKSIDDFNKAEDEKKKIQQMNAPILEKKIFYNERNLCKCINKGCGIEFEEKENNESSCSYHPGNPIFHDLKKYWSCCNKETYDWDEFMKLPKCTKGKHAPKYI